MNDAFRVATAALILWGCASGPEPKPQVETEGAKPAAGAVSEEDRTIAATLRTISTRVAKGEGAQVHAEYAELLQSRPNDKRLQTYLAWVDAPSEDSWQEIQRIAKLVPDDPWPRTLMGLIYLQWKNFTDQADAELNKALAVRPGFVPAEVGKADELRVRGKPQEAARAYEAVLAKEPGWPEALKGLAQAELDLGQEAEARKTLEAALKANPDDIQAVGALARLAMKANDVDAAIVWYGKLLEFAPKDRAGRVALAKLKEQKGDLDGAAKELEKAVQLGTDLETLKALAEAYEKLNRSDDEARILEKVAQLESNDPAPWVRIAELKEGQKDLDGAQAALRSAIERKPGDPQLLLRLAKVEKERDDLIAAIEAFRAAKAKGADVGGELAALEKQAALPEKPASGDVNKVYATVSSRLNKLYTQRKKQDPKLAGMLRLRVNVDASGKAESVEVVEDGVKDQVLLAHAYFGLKDAGYPKAKRTPTFEFELKGP